MTCRECGSVSLSQDELAAYERRTARLVLTTAHNVGGEALKFARKALGLRQREMADLLETSEQQVSRWEHQEEVDRRLRLAVAALLDVAERDQGGLADLGANESRTLEVVSKAS
jgi:DNA-binding transcriptional regulator YiaG